MVYRILTPLSRFKFGKYADRKVSEILGRREYSYLIWIYFNCSHIDFNEEIKEILLLDASMTIPKPGTDKDRDIKEHVQLLHDSRHGELSDLDRMKYAMNKKKNRRVVQRIHEKSQRRTAETLARQNQGHKQSPIGTPAVDQKFRNR